MQGESQDFLERSVYPELIELITKDLRNILVRWWKREEADVHV